MILSIIIPAYNVEKYISNTLESLINQDDKNFEIIIVDDGSTDNTNNLIKEISLKSKVKNCELIKTVNGGVSCARNRGLYEASGKFVMFLDGDDYVSKDLIKTIKKSIEEKEPDIICWGYDVVNEDKKTIIQYFERFSPDLTDMSGIELLENMLFKKNIWIWTGSVAYNRDFLLNNSLKYTDGCSNGEDQEFIIKAVSISNKVIFLPEILSYYVQREGSISNSYNIKRFDAIGAMKRTFEYVDKINDKRIKKIATVIKNENIIENFLYNFNSCLNYLITQKNFRFKDALRFIYNDLERHYPKLNERIVTLMNNYNGNNKRLLIRIKCFKISPIIYYWLIYFARYRIFANKNRNI